MAVFPAGDSRLVVEAEAAVLHPSETQSAPLLMAIHRLNEAARVEHGWMATIDEADRVLVSKVHPLHGTDAVALQDAVATVLTLAGALAAMVAHSTGAETAPADTSAEEPESPLPSTETFA